MPTTTASFADFELIPSRISAAALVVAYTGAAGLLLLGCYRNTLPLPLVLIALEMLWHEWLALSAYTCSQQGRLVVCLSGEIRWQQETWQVESVKIRTRIFLLLRLRNAGRRRWLLVCRDACNEKSYRILSLWCWNVRFNGRDK